MRKLLFFSVLVFMFGCSDLMPLDPGPDVNMASIAREAHPASTTYTLALTPDGDCPECAPAEIHFTPSGMWHFSNGINGFLLTGGLVGEALIRAGPHAVHLNSETGNGVTNVAVHVELTEPAVGSFDCRAHATFEGYMPPFFLWVENGRWFNCKGSGAFDGKRMILHNTNADNPGAPNYTAVAQIW